MLKYEHHDARDVLERASARETVARVAAGEVVRALLGAVGVEVFSHVLQIGPVTANLGDNQCQIPSAPDYIRKVQKRGGIGKKRKTVKC